MANSAISAEVWSRDGQSQKTSLKVENNLSSLINGINNLKAIVSQLLSELVNQEKGLGSCAVGGEDEDDSGGDDDEKDPQNSKHQPPAKKSRI